MRFNETFRPVARRLIRPLLITIALAAPAVVVAIHQFPDVPTSSPFHDDIDASIVSAGPSVSS